MGKEMSRKVYFHFYVLQNAPSRAAARKMALLKEV